MLRPLPGTRSCVGNGSRGCCLGRCLGTKFRRLSGCQACFPHAIVVAVSLAVDELQLICERRQKGGGEIYDAINSCLRGGGQEMWPLSSAPPRRFAAMFRIKVALFNTPCISRQARSDRAASCRGIPGNRFRNHLHHHGDWPLIRPNNSRFNKLACEGQTPGLSPP